MRRPAPRDLPVFPATGLILIAAVAQAIYFVLQKPHLTRYRPVDATAYAIWLGTLCLLPLAPAAVDDLRRGVTPAGPPRAECA
jgi:drug/metabolite transporter (DMT)-like permease